MRLVEIRRRDFGRLVQVVAPDWLALVVAILAVIGAWYGGIKTGRGRAWDEQHVRFAEVREEQTAREALAVCAAGGVRDRNGFWRAPDSTGGDPP